jgi:hypothetical protein
MQLNPTLAKLLEAYELEELNTLVGWLEPEARPLTDESLLSKEEPVMNTTFSSAPVVLDDLVEFSILNEFGPDFQGKSCFDWLRQCMIQRFNPTTPIQ